MRACALDFGVSTGVGAGVVPAIDGALASDAGQDVLWGVSSGMHVDIAGGDKRDLRALGAGRAVPAGGVVAVEASRECEGDVFAKASRTAEACAIDQSPIRMASSPPARASSESGELSPAFFMSDRASVITVW